MYLSRLLFNPLDRKAHNALKDAYALHQHIMRGFPAEYKTPEHPKERILFRQEPQTAENIWVSVLVQSPIEPDWTVLENQFAHAIKIEYQSINPQFSQGQMLRFRLKANPTITKSNENGKPKRRALVGEKAQREWLECHAANCGFQLQGFKVIEEGFMQANKPNKRNPKEPYKLSVYTVRYEGVLSINHPTDFLNKAFKQGIGSAKGLGCGLLSLARV